MSNDSLPLLLGEGRGEGGRKRRSDVGRARALRRGATPAERKLWPLLRNGLLGAKVRRQHPCGSYVLDFAFFEHQLVVELDGDTHATGDGPLRDARRDAWLAGQGWRVLRFSNREIFANMDGVLSAIAAALHRPHPDPLPGGEGEERS